MPQLTVGSAIAKAQSLLEAAGVPTEQAATTARCIVASDRWGIGSHGLMRLPFIFLVCKLVELSQLHS